MAEDIHIQAHNIGEASRQPGGQFSRADAVNSGLIVAQVVVGQLDAKCPEDAVAIQVDQFTASQWDDKG